MSTSEPSVTPHLVRQNQLLRRLLYRFGRDDNVLAVLQLTGLSLLGVSILARLILFLLQLPRALILVPVLVAALGFLCLLIGGLRLVSRMRPWWRRSFPAVAFLAIYTVGIIVQFYPVLGIGTQLYDALLQVANVLFQVGVVSGLLSLLTEFVIRVRQRLLGTRPMPNS